VKNKANFSHSTVGNFQQAQNINNEIRNFVDSRDHISDWEIKILRELYQQYKETGKRPLIDIQVLHKKLGISEGDFMGTVNDSQLINIDGNYYTITGAGIRFMDSFVRDNKPEVAISGLNISGGPRGQELTGMKLVNNGVASALNIKCFLCADDVQEVNFASIERIDQKNKLEISLGFVYSDTVFSTELLKNLKIVCKYTNKDGFEFSSEKLLSQIKRDDGNYNISIT